MSEQQYKLRGLRPSDIVGTEERVRDTRNWGARFQASIENNGPAVFKRLFAACALIALAVPFTVYVMIPIAGALMLYASSKGVRTFTPFGTLPKVAGEYNPDKDAYFGADGSKLTGILFMATDDETGGEFWINDDYLRRHIAMFGTTGAGKTEALLSICFGVLLNASGYMFVDAKGTYELYAKAYNTARLFGREDDVLLLSYLTGDQDVRAEHTAVKVSNTLNILADATHDGMTQTLGSLIPQASGDNQVWTGMALNLIECVLAILTYRRDYLKQPVSLVGLQRLLVLKNLFATWEEARDAKGNPQSPKYLPDWVYDSLYNFLNSITGFRDDKPYGEQVPDVHKYYSFASMQFGKVLGSFTGLYGYIFNSEYSEINLRDVLLNRRILVGLLPSLGKSPTELKAMGNTLVTAAKQMYTNLLGDRAEGEIGDILENSPSKSSEPQVTIWDEWGQIAPEKGAAVIPAQTRALGICSIFAGQSIIQFGPEAKDVIGSCDLLIGLKLKDSGDTFNLFREKMGEADTAVTTGSRFINDGRTEENDTVQYERRSVLAFSDFEAQTQGQAHFLTNGTFIRGRFPYIAIPMPSHSIIKVNQFLAMKSPDIEQIAELKQAYSTAAENLANPPEEYASAEDDLKTASLIASLRKVFDDMAECGISNLGQQAQAAACAVFADLAEQKNTIAPEYGGIGFFYRDEDVRHFQAASKAEQDFRPFGLRQDEVMAYLLPVQTEVRPNLRKARQDVEDTLREINEDVNSIEEIPEITQEDADRAIAETLAFAAEGEADEGGAQE